MSAGTRDIIMLDQKECWKLWHVQLGTLNATQRYFRDKGIINPKTGNPPTKSGIEKAAFSWAIENPDEARIDLERSWMKEGIILTDEEWGRVLTKMGKLIFYQRPGRFKRFVEKNRLDKWV